MRKSALTAILALCAFLAAFGFACNNEKDPSSSGPVITGVKEVINISESVSEYDFAEGVSAEFNGESVAVSIDYSAVRFGISGEYSVTYSAGESRKTTAVRIYGEPVLALSGKLDVTYAEAYGGILSKTKEVVKDSFGEYLDVEILNLAKDEFDKISYGEKSVTVKAEDCTGNEKEFDIVINILSEDKPVFENLSVDISELTTFFYIGNSELLHLLNDGAEVDPSDYFTRNGYVMLEEQYLREIGAGEYNLEAVLSSGWGTFSLTVTDIYSAEDYGGTDNTVLNFGYGDNLLGEEYAYLWSSTEGNGITATRYAADYTTLHRDGESVAYYNLNTEYLKGLLRAGYNILVMNVTSYTKVSSATFEYTIGGEAPVKMGWMGNDEYTFVLNSDYVFDFSALSTAEIDNITSAGICFNGYTGSTDADWNFKYAKFRRKLDASAYDGENLATEEYAGVWSSDYVKVTYDNQSFAGAGSGTLWESENNAPTVIYLDNLFFKEILERGYTQLHVRFNAFSPNMDFKIEFAAQYYFFPTEGLFEALPDTDYTVDLSGVNTAVITASSGSHFAVYVPSYTADGWYVQWEDISFQKPA